MDSSPLLRAVAATGTSNGWSLLPAFAKRVKTKCPSATLADIERLLEGTDVETLRNAGDMALPVPER
ncbi:hypothetical protein KIPB_007807 [Kipferlia bialata]|uniref:Uncharacterized protein n=1 Tax=Kipferlia bialata TaxID=797122 RepID=A0A9K3D0S7_9EUKA|nr:hypothetical protein KIPB_007807 [Kipferlia bialata]|eukprot:g7807.t1